MAKRNRRCVQCGCNRTLTLTATVEDNKSESDFGMRRLCFPCLLRMAHYDVRDPSEESIKALYACVEDKDEANE